jgi:transcriptional regulator with XRE-family HTH domain
LASSISNKRHAALASAILTERHRSGLTQAEVAKRLRKVQSTIAQIESGQRRVDVVEFLQIADVLGFDPIEIISEIRKTRP